MIGRGYSHHAMKECGCSLRVMVAVSDKGDLQALVRTGNTGARAVLCPSCQRVCQVLNATLENQTFDQAAALRRGHFGLDSQAAPQLESVLGWLHEAMVEAVLEFERTSLAELAYEPVGPSITATVH